MSNFVFAVSKPDVSNLATAAAIAAERPALKRFACRFVKSDTDVDDLVQETMLKALSSLDRYRPEGRIKAWLFTIMRNSFSTNYQRAKREVYVDDIDLGAVSPAAQEWSVQKTEMEMAILRLPKQQREALMLICTGGSNEEAAEKFECAIGTIKSRISRARQSLHAKLDS